MKLCTWRRCGRQNSETVPNIPCSVVYTPRLIPSTVTMVAFILGVRLCSTTQLTLRRSFKVAGVENGLEDTGTGKGKLGLSERVAWTYIHYQK